MPRELSDEGLPKQIRDQLSARGYPLPKEQIVLLGRGQGKRCIAHASMHSFSFRRLRRNHVRIVFSGTEYRVARSI